MLQLHHSHIPHIPTLPHLSHKLVLTPVEGDDDELIAAIEEEHRQYNWQLEDADASSLNDFWTGVEEDLKKDPEWFTFADEESE